MKPSIANKILKRKVKNGRSVGHWCGACHKTSNDKVRMARRKEDSILEYERVLARVSVPFSSLGVPVYICACFFLLAIGGALMVVSMWYL